MGYDLPRLFTDYSWWFLVFLMGFSGFLGERICAKIGYYFPDASWLIYGVLVFLFIFAPNIPIWGIYITSYEQIDGFLIISLFSGYTSHFLLKMLTTDSDPY